MFKDEYSKQIDSIRADGYIKQKTELKMAGKSPEKQGNKEDNPDPSSSRGRRKAGIPSG